jgi:ABC-type proline/glycine betaine transport system permease subunit
MRQHLGLTFWPVIIAGVLAIPLALWRLGSVGWQSVAHHCKSGADDPKHCGIGLVIRFGYWIRTCGIAFILRALLPIFLNTYIGVRSGSGND